MIILPKVNITIERWKYNPNYEVYVSNLGNVKDKNGKEIKPLINNQGGYLAFHINKRFINGHRLVLLTWNPVENSDHLTVDHLDKNKRNNRLDNLEWVTQEENLRRAKSSISWEEVYDEPIPNFFVCIGDITTVAQWLTAAHGMNKETDIKRIIARIQKAIRDHSRYCGYKFINNNGLIYVLK